MLVKLSSAFAFLAVIPVSLFAARPFVTDDAGTVAQGIFELECSSGYWDDAASFSIGLKHGLTSHMDLGVVFGYHAVPEDEAAAQPLEISLKYNFIPDHLSASFTSAFSSASYAVNAIYTHAISAFSLNVNLGMEATDAVKNVAATYGLAAVFNVGVAAVGAEIGGVDKNINWWQVGTQITLKDWLAVDLGIGGDFEDDTHLTAASGLWFSFPSIK